ncbi:chemotaxis protein CheB [Hymenobacter cellulosivorans]|uniref:protein-glutamate methylesterase n=1 Tax=Hymenobacter cellulosivorans TaxID=2932249 RepID=A0ABY4F7N5_9BACT|nr:chemotaxis protein CheB [Hymenobacter cellulosivorans]UOQ52122.1 chemotaxis protein CheB [Hymenobacter cellulosivorans]
MDHPTHVIVIGASAGGMPALCQLVAQLPADLPAAVLIVQHFAPDSSGEHLVDRLSRQTNLRCLLPQGGELIEPNTLYLAPPDRHLLVKDGYLLVTKGPHENHYRPAADALFRSAAAYYGPNVIGVVLTGMLHDGTAGLEFVKRSGGLTVVQDPHEAEFPSMPESALSNVDIDYVVPLKEMGFLLTRLARMPLASVQNIPEDIKLEAAIAERVVGTIDEVTRLARPVPMTCPDCGGSLFELKHGKLLRYRCHTGHAFTADMLLQRTQHGLEESLWVALRMMEERKNLLTNMASRGEGPYSVQQEERIEEMKTHINRLREFLLNGVPKSPDAANGPGTHSNGHDQAPGGLAAPRP